MGRTQLRGASLLNVPFGRVGGGFGQKRGPTCEGHVGQPRPRFRGRSACELAGFGRTGGYAISPEVPGGSRFLEPGGNFRGGRPHLRCTALLATAVHCFEWGSNRNRGLKVGGPAGPAGAGVLKEILTANSPKRPDFRECRFLDFGSTSSGEACDHKRAAKFQRPGGPPGAEAPRGDPIVARPTSFRAPN